MDHSGRTFVRCVDVFVPAGAVVYAGTGQLFDQTLQVEVLEAKCAFILFYVDNGL